MVVVTVSSGGSSPCTEVEGSGQVVWAWSRLEADGGRAPQRKACFILLLSYLPTWRLQNCMMCASTVRRGELQMVCGRETEEKSVAWGFTCRQSVL